MTNLRTLVLLASMPTGFALNAPSEAKDMNPSGKEFAMMADQALQEAQKQLDAMMAVTDDRNIANTLETYNELSRITANIAEQSSLYFNVHPDETVRAAAEKAEQAVSAFLTDISLNRDVYDALSAVNLDGADKVTRFAMDKLLRDFRRSGVDKSDQERAKIKKLNDELVKISQEFGANIRNDVRFIELDSADDLAGLPEDYVKSHPPGENGKIKITSDYPDSVPFMQYAKNGEARKRLYMQLRTRGYPKNNDVLKRMLKARHDLANLLGFETWADYITEDKMIASAANAANFIDKINTVAKKRCDADYAMLLDRKKRDDPDAAKVNNWESSYYETQVKEEKFSFDPQAMRPYFEFERVQRGLFDLTSRMFGVEYRKVENVETWHPDVTVWDVYDGDKKLGRFYLDLFPRDNKYKHAACFGVKPGIAGEQLPESALICNFPDPRKTDGPALMEYSDVETFFHEFGHLLHAIFGGHQKWANISGISTEWDFVEAPSQMLEEWLANHEVLSIFARHYKTNEPIPAQIVENLRKANEFGKGVWVRNQMYYASVSLNYYNRDPDSFDPTELQSELMERYSPFDYVDGTHFECSFGHLDGYSAIYYTYMWSLTIAKDLFSRFEREGLLNEAVAREYRRTILEPGGSREARSLVHDFLGRDYAFEAYEAWLNRS